MPLKALYSRLPSVDRLLAHTRLSQLLTDHGNAALTNAVRQTLDSARAYIREQQSLPDWASNDDSLVETICQRVAARQQMSLRPVFNLSGTVLHTNLGRAPQAETAITAVSTAMRGAVALEFDLAGGERGHRDNAISELLCELTGAEAACVVNNNAAAVLIMLSTLAAGREVVLSRGELVEIGGSFRMPDVMRQAGCRLVEVGATNRTHLRDYQQALNPNTGLLLKVHTSNYAIQGFTSSVSEAELVALAAEHGLPVASDLGSGALVDLSAYGLPCEPMPRQMIAAGVDAVCFSGDKLLGGPQAGLIIGKRQWIEQIQRHPLKRALRCDKMTLAALEATLRLYLQPDKLVDTLPSLRLLTRPQLAIQQCALRLQPALASKLGQSFEVKQEPCCSQIGSGSLPVDSLPSWALTIRPRTDSSLSIEQLAQQFRALPHPLIGRLKDGRLWLDLRCLEDEVGFLNNLAALTIHH
ncbi:L-seryl-tRNA(Sec) selenium transferase [Neisseriaceae bacterium TC5R-5]|nr:L-seryl-tRNA(Sec) selenium transferase [Neisseriaceae bacterium TC5R-5]